MAEVLPPLGVALVHGDLSSESTGAERGLTDAVAFTTRRDDEPASLLDVRVHQVRHDRRLSRQHLPHFVRGALGRIGAAALVDVGATDKSRIGLNAITAVTHSNAKVESAIVGDRAEQARTLGGILHISGVGNQADEAAGVLGAVPVFVHLEDGDRRVLRHA